MKNRLRRTLKAGRGAHPWTLAMLVGGVSIATAQDEFVWLPGPFTFAESVSNEVPGGPIVSGQRNNAIVFQWQPSTGMRDIYSGSLVQVYGGAAHGSVVLGTRALESSREAFWWTSDNGGMSTEVRDSWATCATPGGESIYMNAPEGVYRWHNATLAPLIALDGYVWDCSIDGNWLALAAWYPNLQRYGPARWSETTGIELLGALDVGGGGAYGIADDGNTLVGYLGQIAFRWTPGSGLEPLPHQGMATWAYKVSADGNVIVGGIEGPHAAIWKNGVGWRSIQDVVFDDYAIDIDGILYKSRDISSDGQFVVGTGIGPTGQTQSWFFYRRPFCTTADLNCDMHVDLTDLALLLANFGGCRGDAGMLARADIDRNGCVDLPDLAALLAAFGTDCLN